MKKNLLLTAIFTLISTLTFSQNFYVSEDFNGTNPPTNWTLNTVSGSQNWSFGIDADGSTTGNQNIDGTVLAFFDDDALGGGSLNNTADILTPTFNNSTIPVTFLEFDYNFYQFGPIQDSLIVDVYDGTNWVRVLSIGSDDCGRWTLPACRNRFPRAKIDISSLNNANCQVRFRYFDGNDWGFQAGIDNVDIYSPYDNNVGVSQLIDPVSSCGKGAAEPIQVKIKNYGYNSASGFNVIFSTTGAGTQSLTELISATIPPGDSLTYTFTALANMSTVGQYDILTYTDLTNDAQRSDDTLSIAIQNEQIYTPIYVEDFETPNPGWKVSGTNASWQRGVPAGPVINTAAGGQNAYVTNLTGSYNSSEFSYLTSACMDFSANTADPILSFSLWRRTETNFDVCWLESSIDNGITWTKVLANPTFAPTNWYNNANSRLGAAWDGNSGGWIAVENVLDGLGGESQVKLRFVLASDGSTNQDGIGIDNFGVRDPQPIDAAVNRVVYPTSGQAPLCGFSTERVQVEYENKGTTAVDSLFFSYQVDGGPVNTDTLVQNTPIGAIRNYQFRDTYDFSAIRNYTIKTWVNTPGDSYNVNDTIDNVQISDISSNSVTIPYREVFDAGFTPGNPGTIGRGWTTTSTTSNNGQGSGFFYSWWVENGTTGSFNTGPNQDATGGNYMYTEGSYAGGIATLESPCINLSNNSGARLVFKYFRWGTTNTMSDTYVDVYDGIQWVNNVDRITGITQTSGNDDWLEREVSLNQFAGRKIKIRFRGIGKVCCQGDMAIDDVYIFEPVPRDVALVDVVSPRAGCEISSASPVTVEIQNIGTLAARPDSVLVYYQLDGGPIVRDTLDILIPTETSGFFTFTQTANLGVPGQTYNFKAWTEMIQGDLNILNDTLQSYNVKNTTLDLSSSNYTENFERFRAAFCDNPIGQILENGWSAPETDYAWNVQKTTCGPLDRTTPTPSTGPSGDHTSGTGVFLYTEAADIDGDGYPTPLPAAILESPCIDLTNNTSAAMSFWYHKYGSSMGTLFVDVFDNGVWVNGVGQINGRTQTNTSQNWKLLNVNLTPYVGDLIQVRFRGVTANPNNRSDMAIDDVIFYNPIPNDVSVSEVISPLNSGCNLPSTAPVTIRVVNNGLQAIPSGQITLSYKQNSKAPVTQLLNQSLAIGASTLFTFTQVADLTIPGTINFEIKAVLAGDSVLPNNTFIHKVINHKMGLPYSFEDFELHRVGGNAPPGGYPSDYMKDWRRSPNPSSRRPQWHVWQGPGPMVNGEPMPNPPIPPNGPSGDHTFATKRANGEGTYMLYESKFRSGTFPDASLLFPCGGIDLSSSVNNRILLSFWYHRFGVNMPDVFIDVFDGTQWVNGVGVIRGVQMGTKDEPWKRLQFSLDAFAGVPNADIRFRGEFKGIGGDCGIDDILIMDRLNRDIAVNRMKDPRDYNTQQRCGKANNERVIVEVQNTGIIDVLSLTMSYQITWTPLDGDPIVLPTVTENRVGFTISGQNNGGIYSFEFPTRADLSQPGKYEFKIWSNYPGDQYAFNDTIYETVVNETRPFPYCEDFSSFLTGWTGYNFNGGTFPSTWIGSTGDPAAAHHAIMANRQTGPIPGHTGGVNDLYVLMQGGMPGQSASIESPCYDLTSTPTANLEFWYTLPYETVVVPGNPPQIISGVLVEVARGQGGGPWEPLDTLYGAAVTSWTPVRIVLADFAGDFVRFRFRHINGGGIFTLDDLCVVPPPPQQIELERIPYPPVGRCFYSSAEIPVVRVQNIGIDVIDSFRVRFAVDKTVQTFPRGNHVQCDRWYYRGVDYGIFQPGDKIDLSLITCPVDMTDETDYWFYATVYLPGDQDTTDNIVENYQVNKPVPFDITYTLDFEDPVDPYQTWLHGAQPFYSETVKSGLDQGGLTGPADDHTLQNGRGKYWVTQAAAGDPGNQAILQSECVDFTQATLPTISYWYHMFGFQMGNLFLQANDDFGWRNIDSLKGEDPDQPRNSAAWKNRTIYMPQYAGKLVRFRFVSFRGGGSASNMALDDIIIYDLPPKDVRPDSLFKPTEDITSCYSVNQELWVNVKNNGGDSIRFNQDTLNITATITRDGQPWAVLTKQVSSDIWFNQNTGLFEPLPSDTSVAVLMDGTFDMYHIGSLFGFGIKLDLQNDEIPVNDSAYYTVLAREEGGNISVNIFPNDTVCSGNPVQVTLENYFGQIAWQERTVNSTDTGFWIPGNFPNNLETYLTFQIH